MKLIIHCSYGEIYSGTITSYHLIQDYIKGLNEVEDADTIEFLRTADEETAIQYVCIMWGLSYEIVKES